MEYMRPQKKWLRPNQVADRLNISKRSVYRLLVSGQLVGFRINGPRSAVRIDTGSVDDYVARQIAAFQFEEGVLPLDEKP